MNHPGPQAVSPPNPKRGMAGPIAAGCGALALLVSCAVGGFGGFHVFADPDGRISGEEALPALVGGGVCCFFSVLLLGVAGYLIAKRK